MGWVHLGPKGPGPAASGGGDCPRHGSVQGGRDPPLWGRASGQSGRAPQAAVGGVTTDAIVTGRVPCRAAARYASHVITVMAGLVCSPSKTRSHKM